MSGNRRYPSRDPSPDLVPGTVELFSKDADGQSQGLISAPTPSGDPNEPLVWPMWRKCWNFGLLTAMTMAIFAALNIQPIFWSQMLKDMDVTMDQLTNGGAVQLGGMAIGCIIFIPFANKYGRRPVYIVSIALLAAFSFWAAVMKTAAEFYATNVLIGLAGAVNEAAVQMSIRDMFFVHQRGTANGVYFIAVKAGSSLIPMAAGAQAESSGFRSCYMSLGASMTALAVLFALSFEETKFVPDVDRGMFDHDQLAFAREDKLEAFVSEMDLKEKDSPSLPPFPRYLRLQLLTRTDESLWTTFYNPGRTARFPHVVYASLVYGASICWFTVIGSIVAIVFSAAPYNFNSAQIGYMFGGQAVGAIFGCLYGGYLTDWAIKRFAKRNGGLFEPEMRLYLMPLPALAMSAGLVIFGVTAERGLNSIIPALGGAVYSFGFGAASDISCTVVIDAYPNLVAETFVVVAFFRNVISMAGPLSISPWMDRMGVGNITIIAASINLAINLIGLPLAIWGKRSRASIAPLYYRLSKKTA